ncbi:MAG: PhoH family protein [Myxococcota bacterium]
MSDDITQTLSFDDAAAARALYGERDLHLRAIEKRLEVSIGARGAEVTIAGAPSDVRFTADLIDQLYRLSVRGHILSSDDLTRSIEMLFDQPKLDLAEIFLDTVVIQLRNKRIAPKTITQKAYLEAIREHDLTFGIGPAGTGKTFLAVAKAIQALQEQSVRRIILTRPAVEAGERLGFLPGDLTEKVHPYLRPLLDALGDLTDVEQTMKMQEKGVIEIAPLAFMRGRTLSDAFIILDEAQNTTREQMKMFLTRLGHNSKAVVTGDITQIDLHRKRDSGLIQASQILRGVEGISQVRFTGADVVRHSLVQRIIRAYDAQQDGPA